MIAGLRAVGRGLRHLNQAGYAYIWCNVAWALLITMVARGQNMTCLDTFGAFSTVDIDIPPLYEDTNHNAVMEWYSDSRCIVVGNSIGLWLYDPDLPNEPLHLVTSEGRSINQIAVNLMDGSIAFSAVREPLVHVIDPDGITSTIQPSGDIVMDMIYSPDGQRIAIASGIYDAMMDMSFDSRVEVWDINHPEKIATINSEYTSVYDLFFNPDGQSLLINDGTPGYGNTHVEYFDIDPFLSRWDDRNMLDSLPWHVDFDPLAILQVDMRGELIALAGLSGYHNFDEYFGEGVQIWNAETMQWITNVFLYTREDKRNLGGLAVRANDLLTVADDGQLQQWSLIDGHELAHWNMPISGIDRAVLSPDEQFLALKADQTIYTWDIEAAQITAYLKLDGNFGT